MATRLHRTTPTAHAQMGVLQQAQSIYETSSTAKHEIGQRMKLGDGRVFYYAKMGSTATSRPGVLLSASVDRAEDTTGTVAESIGDKEVALTAVGTITASQFAGGYLVANAGTGSAQMYRIRDNLAAASGASVTVYLYDELQVALSAASCCIHESPFYAVDRDITAAQNTFTLGAALVAVPADYYFWLQTWGPIGLVSGDALGDADTERECFVHASGISVLSTAAGAAGAQPIGYRMLYNADAVSGEWSPVFLTIWP